MEPISCSSLRTLRAGLLSIAEVEKQFGESSRRKYAGAVLKACEELVTIFDSFSENGGRKESGFVFRDHWQTSESHIVEEKMRKEYLPACTTERNHYVEAVRLVLSFRIEPK